MSDEAQVQQVKEALGSELFEELLRHFKTGYLCLADIAQIPMSELENLTRLARQHLLRKDYDKAVKLMDMVVHLYPHSHEFWGTYGICLQHHGKYLKARTAYSVAMRLEYTALEWVVYSAECELMLQNPKFALELVKPIFHQKSMGPKGAELLKRAQRIKSIADNMESGPNDLPAVEAARQKRLRGVKH